MTKQNMFEKIYCNLIGIQRIQDNEITFQIRRNTTENISLDLSSKYIYIYVCLPLPKTSFIWPHTRKDRHMYYKMTG